jgi:hypothetical protein
MKGKDWARTNLFRRDGGVAEAPPPEGPAGWLAGLQLGPAQALGGLELWPLLHPDAVAEPDLLAPDAIAAGLLDVREKNGGTVQELMVANRAARPVLLFEGEILLGAKQNRMVAHTVMIAAGVTVVMPVGCVERGRWHWTAPGFAAAPCSAEPSLRRSAKASVAAGRAASGRVALDQSALWAEVDSTLEAEGVRSTTSDYNAVQRQRQAAAEQAAARVTPLERQVGVMALRDGVLVALDLVGSAGTWRAVCARVVRSLWPAGARGGTRAVSGRGPAAWLASLQRVRPSPHPAVGLGRDVTLEGDGLVGSGVWIDGRPAHLSVFGA